MQLCRLDKSMGTIPQYGDLFLFIRSMEEFATIVDIIEQLNDISIVFFFLNGINGQERFLSRVSLLIDIKHVDFGANFFASFSTKKHLSPTLIIVLFKF